MTTFEPTDITEAEAKIRQAMADADRKRQEIALAPRISFAQLLTAFAAATAAAAALMSAGAGAVLALIALIKAGYIG